MSDEKKDLEKKDVKLKLTELEKTKEKMEEYLNGWKRAKADYSNQKKEFERKEQEIIQFANATLILEIMPIYDNFKLAWKHIPEEHKNEDEWLKGIEHIKKQFADMLKRLGLEEIPTVGEKFDPELHEAVGTEKVEGKKSGEIVEEIKSGYKLYNKVLEPAKVKTAE
ncbi:MAG: nucleotide exchange factor GrpE [Candidatus Kerfeldbacteria bacterium]